MPSGIYEKKILICKYCQSEFIVNPAIKRLFCSYRCYWNFLKGKTSTVKGKHWKVSKKARKNITNGNKGKNLGKHYQLSEEFCRQHKETAIRINSGKYLPHYCGKNSPRWKGGITPENAKIRSGIEFRLWREAVFARDNWTCQKTKVKGGKLHPHHIQNFSQFPKLRFAIDNGITLSERTHIEFHQKYGKKNNTREQLFNFLKEQS